MPCGVSNVISSGKCYQERCFLSSIVLYIIKAICVNCICQSTKSAPFETFFLALFSKACYTTISHKGVFDKKAKVIL